MKAKLHLIFIIILSIAGIVLLNVGYIFFLLAFLPSVTAYMIDGSPNKNVYKATRAFNIMGIAPVVFPLVEHKHPAAQLQVIMGDFGVWLQIYGVALAGCVLLKICGLVSYFLMIGIGDTRILVLEQAQKDLVKEWGDGIVQGVGY